MTLITLKNLSDYALITIQEEKKLAQALKCGWEDAVLRPLIDFVLCHECQLDEDDIGWIVEDLKREWVESLVVKARTRNRRKLFKSKVLAKVDGD